MERHSLPFIYGPAKNFFFAGPYDSFNFTYVTYL